MAKQQQGGGMVLNLIAWFTGVVVSLAVGFGLVDGVLSVRWIHPTVTMVVGWIVVITTLVGAVMAILKK